MRRIAVTGGRDFNDASLVWKAFDRVHLTGGDVIVHGGCKGADLLCMEIAEGHYGSATEEHPADWKKYGRAAGPIRNREMLESNVDLLIAFPGGKGTFNCFMTAKSIGIPVLDMGGWGER